MITNKITEMTQHLQGLSKKEFRNYLTGTLVGIGLLCTIITVSIYHKSSALRDQLKKLNKQAREVEKIVAQHRELREQEEKIKQMLIKHPDFNINTYFERFMATHKLKTDSDWTPRSGTRIQGARKEDTYQEMILRASFKQQTMQKLVTILDALYKEPLVYVKELDIATEDGKIAFDITLATKLYKKATEL